MHIAYFITSHGYGHGIRATAIANKFSSNVDVTFRTLLPERFFEEELKRKFSVMPARYDCGCLQTDGVTVDIESTLETYRSIATANRKSLEAEVRWCTEQKIDLIVSDITPFAFEIAHHCSIPSIAVSNFTWFDIYSEYLSMQPEFKPFLDKMLEQYSYADILIALEPALDMKFFKRKVEVPITGRKGCCRRDELLNCYKLADHKKLGLIYTGDFGMSGANWERLNEFTEWEFLGLYPLPGNPSNFHIIDKNRLPYQDLTASVDCVISKIGYGVFSECFLNGTPLVYLPRKHFAEYPVLENAVKQWGMGYCLSQEQYYNLQWENALNYIAGVSKNIPSMDTGAVEAARIIETFIE